MTGQHPTMMTSTTSDARTAREPSVRELSAFLSRYSARLAGAGATCIRLEKNVTRMARVFNKEVEMTIMPSHIHITLWENDSPELTTAIATVRHNAVSFNINSQLSRLSWEVADRKIGFHEAVVEFDRIIASDRQNANLVVLLVGLANASFCRLFGGDWVAMAIVCIATMGGYMLKQAMMERHIDSRAVWLACSFLSSVLGATGLLFSLGDTPAIALGTSVLYLVPGIPFLNSFSDMLYRHYLCALSRFADAVVLTCCLSAGLCAGMLLMDAGMF